MEGIEADRILGQLCAAEEIGLALVDGSRVLHRRIFERRLHFERQDGYAVSTAYMEGIEADRILGQLCAAEEIGLALVDGSGVLNSRIFERRSYLERQDGYAVSARQMEGIEADRILGQQCAAEEIGLALVDGSRVLHRRIFERRLHFEDEMDGTVAFATRLLHGFAYFAGSCQFLATEEIGLTLIDSSRISRIFRLGYDQLQMYRTIAEGIGYFGRSRQGRTPEEIVGGTTHSSGILCVYLSRQGCSQGCQQDD